jgi:hypothetical protein
MTYMRKSREFGIPSFAVISEQLTHLQQLSRTQLLTKLHSSSCDSYTDRSSSNAMRMETSEQRNPSLQNNALPGKLVVRPKMAVFFLSIYKH